VLCLSFVCYMNDNLISITLNGCYCRSKISPKSELDLQQMKTVHDIEECKMLTKNNGKIVLRGQVLLYCTSILRLSILWCFMVSEAELNRKLTCTRTYQIESWPLLEPPRKDFVQMALVWSWSLMIKNYVFHALEHTLLYYIFESLQM